MRPFRDLPIQRKLILVIMLTSSVTLLLAAAAAIAYERVMFRTAAVRELSSKAEIIGANCAAALAFEDAKVAEETLASLRADSEIVAAAIYAANGRLFAQYFREKTDRHLLPAMAGAKGEKFEGRDLTLFRPVVLEGDRLGTVHLRTDLRRHHARLRAGLWIAVAMLLASALVALVLSARLQRVISEPILELARVARSVTENKDYSLQAIPHTHDEIGTLTDAFDQMLTGIQEREMALKNANVELGERSQQLQHELAERQRAQATIEERARLAALGAEVGVALTRSDTLRTTLQHCAEALVRHLDAAFARIWTLNIRGDILELQASAGMYTHLDGSHGRMPVGADSKIGLIALDRQPHLTNAVIGDPQIKNQDWAKQEGMTAFAGYPLIVEGSLVGVMAMFSRQPIPDATLQAMASVANGIALGIEHKLAEQALRDSEDRLRAIMDNSPAVMYLKDVTGRYLFVNRRFETLFHVTRTTVTGKTDHDLFPKEAADAFRANDLKVLRAVAPVEFEELAPHDDGLHTYISEKFPLLQSDGVPYAVCGISTDITERKRLEEQLIQAEKMESVGRLAAGVAHEVKNPLTIVGLGIDYLEQVIDREKEDLATVLKDMSDAIVRANSVINGLLDFSVPTKLRLDWEDLNDVIERSLALVKHELTKNHVETVREPTPALPPLRLDRNKMEQVFVNLFMNAVHAMPRGGSLVIRIGTTPASRSAADHPGLANGPAPVAGQVVRVEIEDTGTGIPADKLGKVFEPFFTTKSPGKGTGLGLSVVKQIVQLHGGTIDLSNRKEGGLRVSLLFNTRGKE